MRAVLAWVLRRVAGPSMASEILGDLAESDATFWPLLAITTEITMAKTAEVIAETWSSRLRLGGVWSDARYSARALRRTPWYATTVIGVIALSMSLAITVFAVVDGVLFKPLPYPRVNELIALDSWRSRDGEFAGSFGVSASDLYAWKAAVPTAEFAAYSISGSAYIDNGDQANYAGVTENFFTTLEQRPIIGGFDHRDFEGKPSITPILIDYGCWQRRFGGDPAIVGRVIRGDFNEAWQVKGVLGENFLFPDTGRFVPEFLTPITFGANPQINRIRQIKVVARVPSTTPLAATRTALSQATLQLAAMYPGDPAKPFTQPFDRVTARPFDEKLRSTSKPIFGLVFAASAVLVLLGCLNITGLAAARVQDRRRELALRRSLGATRSGLVRLLGAESAIIVMAGGLLGLIGAAGLIRIVKVVLPEGTVLFRALAIDARVAVFSALVSALAICLTTIWPAWVSMGKAVRPVLAEASGTTAQRRVMRGVIVGAQIGLSLVMALGAVLVGRSLWRVWEEDPGFGVRNMYTLSLSARSAGQRATVSAVLADVQRTPGVVSASGSNFWLLARAIRGSSFTEPAGVKSRTDIESMGVTPGYFETAGITAVEGRLPTDAELESGAPVLVVSREVARQFWPGRQAVGETLMRKTAPFTVIGVVPDGRYVSYDREPDGDIYYPLLNDEKPSLTTIFVRADRNRDDLLPALQQLMTRYPMFRVTKAQTMAQSLGQTIRMRQFRATLFVAFGIAGVVIAGIGVLALVAITTSRRTREVGVRMALGAKPTVIAGMVVRQELVAVVCGLAAGGIASFWIVRLLKSYMYKTEVYDPAMWITAIAVLLIVATVGSLVPAMRASRVDPVKALRQE